MIGAVFPACVLPDHVCVRHWMVKADVRSVYASTSHPVDERALWRIWARAGMILRMNLTRVLVANRGEIAVRIARALTEAGMDAVMIASVDDQLSPHLRAGSDTVMLGGTGVAAYLDIAGVIAAATRSNCDAVHPGYGFLSENDDFADACAAAGLTFIGPRPDTLRLFGDKVAARARAVELGIPVSPGTEVATPTEAAEFYATLPPGSAVIVKAVAGGGGRGMRVARTAVELNEAITRCQSEAASSFGNGAVFVERLLERARHIEVQIVGDGSGAVAHLGIRECTVQRRHQKLVEIAPSPSVVGLLRTAIIESALRLAADTKYANVGTFEFLVDLDAESGDGAPPDEAPTENDALTGFVFIEANPRLQVEHTVTEEVAGVDLVQLQLAIANGTPLADLLTLHHLSVDPAGVPERGFAIQLRVNMERMSTDGSVRPSGGTIAELSLPSGPGVRVDTFAAVGYKTSALYDSLLAKIIVSTNGSFEQTRRRAVRALTEMRIGGLETNRGLLLSVLDHPDFVTQTVDTQFFDREVAALVRHADEQAATDQAAASNQAASAAAPSAKSIIDRSDPLAVLAHGKLDAHGTASTTDTTSNSANNGNTSANRNTDHDNEDNRDEHGDTNSGSILRSPMPATVLSIAVEVGTLVAEGTPVLVLEAMKMEHVLEAPESGRVTAIAIVLGQTIDEGERLLVIDRSEVDAAAIATTEVIDLDRIRRDLAEAHARQALTQDEARPKAVARRRATNQRTTRENVMDLLDEGSFVEYGSLVIAAQRRRRSVEDLIENTPADGMVAGIGSVNGDLFGPEKSRCMVMSYDYTVLAGTQGLQNHRKKDRMFSLAEDQRLPLVFFTEGGGGRPGDTDGASVAGLDGPAFARFGKLSGLVPLVGINSGYCFAGNAALLGCCDVVIATKNSSIGMGGPAMIDGGGLGVYHPMEVGPISVQAANGVVDIVVEDEADAVRVAKQYLSYFQGPVENWTCPDQRLLRSVIPENRLRAYDVHRVLELLVDDGSLLELRAQFGLGMVTAFGRIEGRPIGILANNPVHLAGAIDSDGADKAARFLQLCDAFDIPVLSLVDTPGMMVGPDIEKTALVRHCSRLFVTSASMTVPHVAVVLRKGYGLGAMAMTGGSFHETLATVSWPTGEFGGMGLEGAVKLGYRKELEAETDPQLRKQLFDEMVARMYAHGKALSAATYFEIDDVIDPLETRSVVSRLFSSAAPSAVRTGKKRPCVDTW